MKNSNEVMQYEKPWIVNLELTNACNLNCIFCNYPALRKKMLIKKIDEQLLLKLFSDLKSEIKNEKIYELGLVGLGEPTLDRCLEKHLQIINKHAWMFERIAFNSNAVALEKKQAKILLKSKVNVYTFSVNASNKEMYLKMMGVDRFNLVIDNLRTFFRLMKNCEQKPKVDIQLFESGSNNIEDLKKLFPGAQGLNIGFFYRKIYSKPAVQENSRFLNVYKAKQKFRYPCWDIYSRIYIDVEGNVYPCTIGNDSYRESSNMCLGNLFNDFILTLFNNEKIQAARLRAERGKLSFPECRMCNIWSLTPNNFEWDETQQTWRKKKKPVRAYGLKG